MMYLSFDYHQLVQFHGPTNFHNRCLLLLAIARLLLSRANSNLILISTRADERRHLQLPHVRGDHPLATARRFMDLFSRLPRMPDPWMRSWMRSWILSHACNVRTLSGSGTAHPKALGGLRVDSYLKHWAVSELTHRGCQVWTDVVPARYIARYETLSLQSDWICIMGPALASSSA